MSEDVKQIQQELHARRLMVVISRTLGDALALIAVGEHGISTSQQKSGLILNGDKVDNKAQAQKEAQMQLQVAYKNIEIAKGAMTEFLRLGEGGGGGGENGEAPKPDPKPPLRMARMAGAS